MARIVGRITVKEGERPLSSDYRTQGVALVAALVLMAMLNILGAAILAESSTEVAISGHYRRSVEAFYAAESAMAEGRARLRGSLDSHPKAIVDPAAGPDPFWSAYILTSAEWLERDDPTYSRYQRNYVPLPGMQTNVTRVVNSVQEAMPYWVKLTHKTEYDAERDGHRSEIPQYRDLDGDLRRHRQSRPGRVIYYGYDGGAISEPVQFTAQDVPMGAFPVERVVALAGLHGASVRLEADVAHPPAPPLFAAMYATHSLTFSGSTTEIRGDDACGMQPSIPPVYVTSFGEIAGSAVFHGTPPSPRHGSVVLDMQKHLMRLYAPSISVAVDQWGQVWGESTAPVTVHIQSSTLPSSFRVIGNTTGYGVLLLEGNAQVSGPLHWHGLVVGSGTIRFNASTGPIHIQGAVLADHIVDTVGGVSVAYDSCAIHRALLSQPLSTLKWRQLF